MKNKKFINGNIQDFIVWQDKDGKEINASDGGIIFVDDKYYWYGMALRNLPVSSGGRGGQTTTVGVVMYSSEDLYNWEFERVILPCSAQEENPLHGPMRFERPKIIFNKQTKKYVLWCHYVKEPGDHGTEPGTGEAGVATCDTINGIYEWHGYTRPINQEGVVRDCTVYQELSGDAYFIYDRDVFDDRCLYVVKLTSDYLAFTNTYSRINSASRREAACVVRYGDYYFIITSGLTGWEANQAKYFRTKNLLDDWEDMGDPFVGSHSKKSFETQGTFIFQLNHKNVFIYMTERHNISNFERCSYVWLPIHFSGNGKLELKYYHDWQYENFSIPN